MRRLWSFLLPRYVAGTLPGVLARRFAQALRDDVELAAAYDALRAAERVASSRSLSIAQTEAMQAQLFGALPSSPTARSVRPSRSSFTSPLALLLATTAAVCFVVVRAPSTSFGVGDLEARGAKIAASPVGVKVTCLDRAGTTPIASATAGARRAMDVLKCPSSSLLAFSTTNLSAEARNVFVVGVAADGSRRWYAPFTPGSASVAVAPGVVDDVLPSVADTANMPAGPVTLYVLVSDAPFSADDVEHALSSSERNGIALGHVDRLPIDVPLQARIDVQP